MIPTTIKIRCQHLCVRIAQVFRIGQLSLRWITPGHQKSTNASTCGFFDSKEAAFHRGIYRQMRSLITQRSNLELTIAIEQWTPLSSSLEVRRNKDSTEFVSQAVRNWYLVKPRLFPTSTRARANRRPALTSRTMQESRHRNGFPDGTHCRG